VAKPVPSTGAAKGKSRDNGPAPGKPPSAGGAPARPRYLRRWIIVALAGVVVALAAYVVVARATDASAFCASCHEMQPYYTAWTQGHHKSGAQCVDCHVDAGFVPRLSHKFVALAEVWTHVVGRPTFPMPTAADVPDSRCMRCHPHVAAKKAAVGFSHALHAKQGRCELCHPTAGHDVTAQALRAAGVYDAVAAARRARTTSATAAPGAGKANVPGHLKVSCSECHDLAATGCSACHMPRHEALGDCTRCHQAGARFTFTHGPTGMPNWQKIACPRCHPVSYTQVNCTCHGGRAPKGD
jgi:nitrate/TMAO reductase-like tetraheme cytochrome c subunit